MAKLIASDFDGTMGSEDEQFARDAEAVRRFRAAGNYFGFVSGRNSAALEYLRDWAKLEVDFLLADNGGTCHINGEPIFCVEANEEAMLPLCDYLMSRETKLIAVNREDGTDMIYDTHSDGREEYEPRRALWKARKFSEISAYFSTLKRCHEAAEEVMAIFPHLDALPNGRCLDIVPRGSGKNVGVGLIAQRLGVDVRDVYTIGDNYNDLSMIRAFNGFAVENAPDDVKKQAPMGTVESVEKLIEKLMA